MNTRPVLKLDEAAGVPYRRRYSIFGVLHGLFVQHLTQPLVTRGLFLDKVRAL